MAKKKTVEELVPIELEEEFEGTLEPVVVREFVPERVQSQYYVSSGLTLLNLACTNDPDCFMEQGTYTLMIGQSGSGKSLEAVQILAEAANNKYFDDYALIYDDAENGCMFDIRRMFGDRLADRMRAPKYDASKQPIYSSTIEDFFFTIDDYQDAKRKMIYVLDSVDCLTSSASDTKFDENKAQRQKDLEAGKDSSVLTQGYGDMKAKVLSQNLRRVVNRLGDTGSLLIIICQIRDNITGYGAKFSRAGGHALKFYAHQELWFYNGKPLKRVIDTHERKYGTSSKVVIEKNRISGMKSEVEFPILIGHGISDMDSCLDWLVSEGCVTAPARSNGLYEYPAFGLKLNREALLCQMEADFEPFKQDMAKKWHEILAQISSKRKRKYV